MTTRLDEYHRWMREWDRTIRSVLEDRAGPDRIAVALQARERALEALRPPDTVEERRVLVDSLLDHALAFNGSVQGAELDAATRLRLREEALATAEKLGAADVSRAQAAVLVGISLVTQHKQPQRAAALLEHGVGVLESNPRVNVPWLIKARENLGAAWLQLERWTEAAVVFDEVQRLWLARPDGTPPNEPTGAVSFNLGIACEQLGRWAKARDAYLDACARHLAAHGAEHPNHIQALLRLGVVLAKLGEKAEARRHLDKVTDVVVKNIGTDHKYYREARAVLERL
jgi:tetratricopeptide (TPR) repeat protein